MAVDRTVDDALRRMQAWRDTFEQTLVTWRDEKTKQTPLGDASIVSMLDAGMAEILALRAERDELRSAVRDMEKAFTTEPTSAGMHIQLRDAIWGHAAVIARAKEGTTHGN